MRDQPAGHRFGDPERFSLFFQKLLVSRRYQLWGNREWIKTLVSQLVLDWVRRALLGVTINESGFIRR